MKSELSDQFPEAKEKCHSEADVGGVRPASRPGGLRPEPCGPEVAVRVERALVGGSSIKLVAAVANHGEAPSARGKRADDGDGIFSP